MYDINIISVRILYCISIPPGHLGFSLIYLYIGLLLNSLFLCYSVYVWLCRETSCFKSQHGH